MCCNLIPAPKQSLLFLPLSWMATSRHQVKTLHSSTEMCSAERERERKESERERYFFLEGVLFLDSYALGSSHSSCWCCYRMWQYQAWMSGAVQRTHTHTYIHTNTHTHHLTAVQHTHTHTPRPTAVQHTHTRAPVLRQLRRARGNGKGALMGVSESWMNRMKRTLCTQGPYKKKKENPPQIVE
jgi:hypothetical protein